MSSTSDFLAPDLAGYWSGSLRLNPTDLLGPIELIVVGIKIHLERSKEV